MQFDPLAFGYSAQGEAIAEILQNFPDQISVPAAVFTQTFAVGSGDPWIETSASVARRLTDSALLNKAGIVGLSPGVRPDYVHAVADGLLNRTPG